MVTWQGPRSVGALSGSRALDGAGDGRGLEIQYLHRCPDENAVPPNPGHAEYVGERLLHVGEKQVVDEEEKLVRARLAPRAVPPEPHLLVAHGRRGEELIGGGGGVPRQTPGIFGMLRIGRLRQFLPDQADREVKEEGCGREQGYEAEEARDDEPDAVVAGQRRQRATVEVPLGGHAEFRWPRKDQDGDEKTQPFSLGVGVESRKHTRYANSTGPLQRRHTSPCLAQRRLQLHAPLPPGL